MILVSSVPRLTGFFAVSATHAASGSPVITGMVTPRPGSLICWARDMTAELSCVFCRISLDTSPGRAIEVVRLISVAIEILLCYLVTCANQSANCSLVEPVGV